MTKYPVPYIVWKKKTKSEISQDLPLEKVLKITRRIEMWAQPLGGKTGAPWITLPRKDALAKLEGAVGRAAYVAHSGVDCGRNNVYWVKVIDKHDGYVIVENFDVGKRKVGKIVSEIESACVFPLLRGENVERWMARPKDYVVVPHSQNGQPIPESSLKIKASKLYFYFDRFKDELLSRSTYKLMGRRQPFYAVFKIGDYTFAPYKVVWKEQAGSLTAAVLEPIIDECLGERVVIPDHKLMLVPCSNKDEAHFICAVLNSSLARLIAKSYVVETQISTHILEYIRVPKYDPSNKIHVRLSNLSKKARQLAQQNQENESGKVEEEIDKVVAQLYGLTDKELKEVKKCLAILEGKENEEESEGVIEP